MLILLLLAFVAVFATGVIVVAGKRRPFSSPCPMTLSNYSDQVGLVKTWSIRGFKGRPFLPPTNPGEINLVGGRGRREGKWINPPDSRDTF